MGPRLSIAAGVLAASLASASFPAVAADAERGGVLAARWCAHCHAVAPGQRRNDADPPDFGSIGRNPGLDAAALSAFLMTPHPRMPDLSLSRREIEDLVAYIRTRAR